MSDPVPAPPIEVDVTGDPAAANWGAQAKILVQQWFPIVSSMLATKNYKPPRLLKLVFKKMDGVAYTTGMGQDTAAITISGAWIVGHPDDFGMVIHEMTHVIQGYPGQSYGDAGWLVEGIADYVRFYKYQPEFPRSEVEPRDLMKASYHDAYRTTAAFLAYVTNKYDFGLVHKLDQALRDGNYGDSDWRLFTGKSVSDLWDEYTAAVAKRRGVELSQAKSEQVRAGQ